MFWTVTCSRSCVLATMSWATPSSWSMGSLPIVLLVSPAAGLVLGDVAVLLSDGLPWFQRFVHQKWWGGKRAGGRHSALRRVVIVSIVFFVI